MGISKYGKNSFKKRNELNELLISQIIILSTAYFLLALFPIFESAFGSFSDNILFNTSLLNFHGIIVKALAILVFLLTLTITYNSLNLLNSYLLEDFLVMISVGGLDDNIMNYQSGPFVYFVILSNIKSFIFAHIIGIFFNIFLSLIFKEIPFQLINFLPNIFILVGCIVNIFISLLLTGKIVSHNLSTNIEILKNYQVDTNFEKSTISSFFLFAFFKNTKSRLSIKIASFNISRLSLTFILNILNYILIALIISSSIIGIIVVNDTADITMKEAIGENSYAITKQTMEQFISRAYDLGDQSDNLDILLDNSFYSRDLILDVLDELHISHSFLDERIILKEKLKITYNLINFAYYDSFVVGYNPDNFFPNFRNFALNNPKTITQNGIMFANWNLLSNPSQSSFVFDSNPNKVFKFDSLIQDPFVKGNAIYVRLDSVTQSFFAGDSNTRNVIFLKNININEINSLRTKLNSIGFSLIDMQKIIEKNSFSIRILGLSLVIIVIPITYAFVALIGKYSIHIIYKRKTLLNTLKMLGAKRDFINDIVWSEIKGFITWGSIIGVLLSIVLVFGLFIPNYIISIHLVIVFVSFSFIVINFVFKQVQGSITGFYNCYIFDNK